RSAVPFPDPPAAPSWCSDKRILRSRRTRSYTGSSRGFLYVLGHGPAAPGSRGERGTRRRTHVPLFDFGTVNASPVAGFPQPARPVPKLQDVLPIGLRPTAAGSMAKSPPVATGGLSWFMSVVTPPQPAWARRAAVGTG